MQLRIVHRTGYEYDGHAVASYNQARLTPLTNPEQIVVHSRVEVAPKPWTFEYRDYFGAHVTAFEVVDPHDTLTVTATSTVHTNRPPGPPPELPWEALAEREVADRWTEYLAIPEIVEPTADFAKLTQEIAGDSALPGEAALALCRLVHEQVEYIAGVTDVQSYAAQAWEQRAGVCQDMAHVAIGGLRSLGIPARYVSGYFHPSRDPAIGDTVRGESHAWVEWWDGDWRAFDPTSNAVPGNRYVSVASGRDYRDVKPLAGIYSGAATSRMFVEVDVTRLA